MYNAATHLVPAEPVTRASVDGPPCTIAQEHVQLDDSVGLDILDQRPWTCTLRPCCRGQSRPRPMLYQRERRDSLGTQATFSVCTAGSSVHGVKARKPA
jgi:hypothetical protein